MGSRERVTELGITAAMAVGTGGMGPIAAAAGASVTDAATSIVGGVVSTAADFVGDTFSNVIDALGFGPSSGGQEETILGRFGWGAVPREEAKTVFLDWWRKTFTQFEAKDNPSFNKRFFLSSKFPALVAIQFGKTMPDEPLANDLRRLGLGWQKDMKTENWFIVLHAPTGNMRVFMEAEDFAGQGWIPKADAGTAAAGMRLSGSAIVRSLSGKLPHEVAKSTTKAPKKVDVAPPQKGGLSNAMAPLVGAGIGFAVGGPLGGAVGGVVGKMLGDKLK